MGQLLPFLRGRFLGQRLEGHSDKTPSFMVVAAVLTRCSTVVRPSAKRMALHIQLRRKRTTRTSHANKTSYAQKSIAAAFESDDDCCRLPDVERSVRQQQNVLPVSLCGWSRLPGQRQDRYSSRGYGYVLHTSVLCGHAYCVCVCGRVRHYVPTLAFGGAELGLGMEGGGGKAGKEA